MRGTLFIVLKSVAVGIAQFVSSLILTLLGSFAVDMNATQNPFGVVLVLTITSLLGITSGGWLGLRLGWLAGDTRYPLRLLASAIGIVVVLGVGFLLGQIREASPFLTGAIVAGIVGFQAPGWVGAKVSEPSVTGRVRS